jgi:hypothetical protein
MGRLGTLLLGMILGAGLVFGSLKYHTVRAADGFHFVPKADVTFAEAYVDIREFGPADWDNHRSLALALVKANKESLIADSAVNSLRESVRSALDELTGSGN